VGVEDEAGRLLRAIAGPQARFRPGQLEAVEALVVARRRVLLVQRTGWGKSAVYFVATRLLRDRGSGPTLLVSPLLALMRNQILLAQRAGVRAETVNSANSADWDAVYERLEADDVDLLLVSPERLNNAAFRQRLQLLLAPSTGLLVVDEVHCISDWGHDFRPDYRRVARVVDLLPRGTPVLGATATANARVIDDIGEQLGVDLVTIRGPLERESLVLAVIDLPAQAARLAWLAAHVPLLPGSGIVYCLTVRDTERVASWLRANGITARAYSGDTDAHERELLEAQLLTNDVKVVVATSALGMGFDKPDLGFVVHYQSPGSPVAYYQQVGRAGRAVDRAFGVLLCGAEDVDIQDFFIRTAFPPQPQAEQVVAFLQETARPSSTTEIEAVVNVRHSRLDTMLKILEVEGAVERDHGRWLRTLQPWSYDAERVEAVTALRRAEQAAMRTYMHTDGCLMAFLRRELDDPAPQACGRCANCAGMPPLLARELPRVLVAAAAEHLRTQALVIEPRKQWPAGLSFVHGRLAVEQRVEEGRALAAYADGGWGSLVAAGKVEGRLGQELVAAAAELVRERWRPTPAAGWVTAVPSRQHPTLVPDFAQRLAERLDLPFAAVVRKVRDTAAQKEMENSAQQLANVWDAFAVVSAPPPGPVLLVDDVVDSRWTLTVVGRQLRRAGVPAVYPLALASAPST
jgi:ATP-dependent DNA helicase RecQ